METTGPYNMTQEQEEPTILPDLGLQRLGDQMIDMPCFIGGKITLDGFDDMATHYIQSYMYRLQWLNIY